MTLDFIVKPAKVAVQNHFHPKLKEREFSGAIMLTSVGVPDTYTVNLEFFSKREAVPPKVNGKTVVVMMSMDQLNSVQWMLQQYPDAVHFRYQEFESGNVAEVYVGMS